MAWEGLSEVKDLNGNQDRIYTEAWKKLSPSEQKSVLDIITNHKKIVVKTVIKSLFSLIVMFCFSNNAIGQSSASKYLLFDSAKDSLIMLDNTHYYKIDNTLFDLDRYNQVDTMSMTSLDKKAFTLGVKQLFKESNELFLDISSKKNLFIETRNEIFEEIYVLEKLQDCKYKRTRVWWIDY